MLTWVRKLMRRATLSFCMEATGCYSDGLAEFLHGKGLNTFVVNPRLIKNYAESENLRNKTDKGDAIIIALYAQDKAERLLRWEPAPQHLRTLRELLRLRQALVLAKDQWKNRIESRSFPELAQHVLGIVAEFKQRIIAVEKQIQAHIKSTPALIEDIKLLRTIKGIGPLTAATILAEIPRIREFGDKRDVVAFAGLNPGLRQSGTSIDYRARLSKKGNARIRKALYMPALTALKHNPRVREFGDRLTARGKHNMSVIGAAMGKLLCLAYGVLKSGKEMLSAQQVSEQCRPKPQVEPGRKAAPCRLAS